MNCGTFLLWFYDRSAGNLAIAYIGIEKGTIKNKVKHHLLKPTIKKDSRFFERKRNFSKYFSFAIHEFNISSLKDISKPKMTKDSEFSTFYNHYDFKAPDGYEEQIY